MDSRILSKHNITWDNRYQILSIEARAEIIDYLLEPFKKRGEEREKLGKEHPKFIVDNDQFDGHIVKKGFDNRGPYSVFLPKADNYNDIKRYSGIIALSEDLSKLASMQRELRKKSLSKKERAEKEHEIDVLFKEIFSQDDFYPFLDVIVYEGFKTYSKQHIIEPYVDYSYLFQRLKEDDLIVKMTHKEFIDWLKTKDHINEKVYDILLKHSSLRSLQKSYSISRENNYNLIFKDQNQPD